MLQDLRERVTSLLLRIELAPNAPPPMPEPVMVTDMRHPEPDMAGLEVAGATGGAAGWEHAPAGAAFAPAPSRAPEGVDPQDPATWYRTPRNAA